MVSDAVAPDRGAEPYNYEQIHSWALYKVFGPKSAEFKQSLVGDAVPKGAALEYNPKRGARSGGDDVGPERGVFSRAMNSLIDSCRPSIVLSPS